MIDVIYGMFHFPKNDIKLMDKTKSIRLFMIESTIKPK